MNFINVLLYFVINCFDFCTNSSFIKMAPVPKICDTYPAMMKLCSYTLPKKDPKNT